MRYERFSGRITVLFTILFSVGFFVVPAMAWNNRNDNRGGGFHPPAMRGGGMVRPGGFQQPGGVQRPFGGNRPGGFPVQRPGAFGARPFGQPNNFQPGAFGDARTGGNRPGAFGARGTFGAEHGRGTFGTNRSGVQGGFGNNRPGAFGARPFGQPNNFQRGDFAHAGGGGNYYHRANVRDYRHLAAHGAHGYGFHGHYRGGHYYAAWHGFRHHGIYGYYGNRWGWHGFYDGDWYYGGWPYTWQPPYVGFWTWLYANAIYAVPGVPFFYAPENVWIVPYECGGYAYGLTQDGPWNYVDPNSPAY